MSDGEPIHTRKRHHSSFPYTIKRESSGDISKVQIKIMQFSHWPKASFSIIGLTKHFVTSSALQTLLPCKL